MLERKISYGTFLIKFQVIINKDNGGDNNPIWKEGSSNSNRIFENHYFLERLSLKGAGLEDNSRGNSREKNMKYISQDSIVSQRLLGRFTDRPQQASSSRESSTKKIYHLLLLFLY